MTQKFPNIFNSVNVRQINIFPIKVQKFWMKIKYFSFYKLDYLLNCRKKKNCFEDFLFCVEMNNEMFSKASFASTHTKNKNNKVRGGKKCSTPKLLYQLCKWAPWQKGSCPGNLFKTLGAPESRVASRLGTFAVLETKRKKSWSGSGEKN